MKLVGNTIITTDILLAEHDMEIRAKAIDECIKIIEETVWKDSNMLVESIMELKEGAE